METYIGFIFFGFCTITFFTLLSFVKFAASIKTSPNQLEKCHNELMAAVTGVGTVIFFFLSIILLNLYPCLLQGLC